MNCSDQEKIETLVKCVFPLMLERVSDALPLVQCFPQARDAIRTQSFWTPWLQRNWRDLLEFVRVHHQQFAHLADVLSTQYQLVPSTMLRAGGIRAVVESKRNRRVGTRIEPQIYLEEYWIGSTESNESIQASIRYRQCSVQIIVKDKITLHEEEQWSWKRLRYHGRSKDVLYQVPIRSGKGVIHFANNVRYEGIFEDQMRATKLVPCISKGIGSLIWYTQDHEGSKQQLNDVECLPSDAQNEWGELQFRHENHTFRVGQDGVLFSE